MAKVYIDRDTGYGFFMWDDTMFEALGYRMTPLKEVPDALVAEYNEVMELYGKMQDKLERYYRENI